LQHISHGLQFLGTFIKETHIVVSKRIINNFKKAIVMANKLVEAHKPTKLDVEKVIASINPYLGILSHYKTYAIRKHILNHFISINWKKHVVFVVGYKKIIRKT